MKKIILFLAILLTLPVAARKYIPGEPWPADGYNLKSYAPEFDVSVQQFPDNDTLYYLKISPNGMVNTKDYYYLTINEQAADSILTYVLTDKIFEKQRHRSKWLYLLMKETQADIVLKSLNGGRGNSYEEKAKQTEWTRYTPRPNMPFTAEQAMQAYVQQRTPVKKVEFSGEQWAHFINQVGFVIKIMGEGAQHRTLYDKVMRGGY